MNPSHPKIRIEFKVRDNKLENNGSFQSSSKTTKNREQTHITITPEKTDFLQKEQYYGKEVDGKQRRVEIKTLHALKSFFDEFETNIVIQKVVRAFKKPYCRDLEIIMGEEYAFFQGLSGKEKVSYFCDRIRKCHQLEMDLIKHEQRRTKEIEEAYLRNQAIDEVKFKQDVENTILPFLKEFEHVSTFNTNYSAITNVSTKNRERKFNNIMSYWKTIESSESNHQCGDVVVKKKPRCEPEPCDKPCSEPIAIQETKQTRYNAVYALLLLVLTLSLLLICLYFFGFFSTVIPEPAEVECLYCDNLFHMALGFLI